MIEADFASTRNQYACETRRRMGLAISDLAAIRWAEGVDSHSVLCLLREQEEAARQAGFPSISRLCRDMEDCLDEAWRGEEARFTAVATSLLDSCRTIQMHAEAVANSLRCFRDDKAFSLQTNHIGVSSI